MVGKSGSAPALPSGKRHLGLEDHKAWKATAVSTQPSFSMRAKFTEPQQREEKERPESIVARSKRPNATTYTPGGSMYKGGKMTSISWGFGSAASREVASKTWQPGPGAYTLPSSLVPNPVFRNVRQVPTRTSKRRPLHEFGNETGPSDYQTNAMGETGRPVLSTAPSFTMRVKPADPADREKKPDATTYSIAPGLTYTGQKNAPSWSVCQASVNRETTEPKEKNFTPGPGKYNVQTTFEGMNPLSQHTACPRVARVDTKRCDPDENVALYPERPY